MGRKGYSDKENISHKADCYTFLLPRWKVPVFENGKYVPQTGLLLPAGTVRQKYIRADWHAESCKREHVTSLQVETGKRKRKPAARESTLHHRARWGKVKKTKKPSCRWFHATPRKVWQNQQRKQLQQHLPTWATYWLWEVDSFHPARKR